MKSIELSLRDKREIVARFRQGDSIVWLAYVHVCKQSGEVGLWQQIVIQRVLRDYMNGEFVLPRWFRERKRGAK